MPVGLDIGVIILQFIVMLELILGGSRGQKYTRVLLSFVESFWRLIGVRDDRMLTQKYCLGRKIAGSDMKNLLA